MQIKKQKQPKKYIGGGTILATGLAAAQAGLGIYQMVQGQKAAAKLKAPSTASPAEYQQLYKQAYDAQLMERQMDEINRSMATSTAALRQAGGRAVLGGLPSVVGAAEQQKFQATQYENIQRQEALKGIAGAKERQKLLEENIYQQKLAGAQQAVEGGLQNIAGGVGQAGMAAIYGMNSKKDTSTTGDTSAWEKASKKGILWDGVNNGDSLSNGEFEYAEDGGMITKGEFSHKTNPIDIIKKGKKIGEMTGGEVILNPTQSERLSKESAYFRGLLKKFNKNK
jgi:hypothetical protein